MTRRLYYTDSHLTHFSAEVLSCEERNGLYAVELSQTAFFPEGGGQKGDVGTLSGVAVTDTREENGRVLHFCAAPIPAGGTVQAELDWRVRFRRMQSHSGEHIVSGLAHSLWGCENVGFHMAESAVTLDFDRELTEAQVRELERRVNRVIWRNVPVRTSFPDPEALSRLEYRQKKPLSGEIRIVEIEGVDRCACCAPHVSTTGEIGSVALTDAMRHRGGMRLTMLAGENAYEAAAALASEANALSRLFSAPRTGLTEAAERIIKEKEALSYALTGTERELMHLKAGMLAPAEGCICLFEPERSGSALRELCMAGAEKAGVLCAVFSGRDGGWKYILCSRSLDLHARARELNAAMSGRGGGSREMIQGSCTAPREELERFFGGYRGEE